MVVLLSRFASSHIISRQLIFQKIGRGCSKRWKVALLSEQGRFCSSNSFPSGSQPPSRKEKLKKAVTQYGDYYNWHHLIENGKISKKNLLFRSNCNCLSCHYLSGIPRTFLSIGFKVKYRVSQQVLTKISYLRQTKNFLIAFQWDRCGQTC